MVDNEHPKTETSPIHVNDCLGITQFAAMHTLSIMPMSTMLIAGDDESLLA